MIKSRLPEKQSNMEAEQEAGLQKHNQQQLTFNGLQTVLAIAMVGVGAEVSNNNAVGIISFQCYN